MRARNRQGAQHRDGLRTGLKANGSVENGGLVECFFGKDGNEHLQHDKFIRFMRDLHDEVSARSFAILLWTLFYFIGGYFVSCQPKINNPKLCKKEVKDGPLLGI